MEALLYFAVWAAFFFLMMRYGCGAHVMGHIHSKQQGPDTTGDGQLRWIPPDKSPDPVCGKMVSTGTAKPSIHDGAVYYFCSRECREQFEAAPGLYLGDTPSRARQADERTETETPHA